MSDDQFLVGPISDLGGESPEFAQRRAKAALVSLGVTWRDEVKPADVPVRPAALTLVRFSPSPEALRLDVEPGPFLWLPLAGTEPRECSVGKLEPTDKDAGAGAVPSLALFQAIVEQLGIPVHGERSDEFRAEGERAAAEVRQLAGRLSALDHVDGKADAIERMAAMTLLAFGCEPGAKLAKTLIPIGHFTGPLRERKLAAEAQRKAALEERRKAEIAANRRNKRTCGELGIDCYSVPHDLLGDTRIPGILEQFIQGPVIAEQQMFLVRSAAPGFAVPAGQYGLLRSHGPDHILDALETEVEKAADWNKPTLRSHKLALMLIDHFDPSRDKGPLVGEWTADDGVLEQARAWLRTVDPRWFKKNSPHGPACRPAVTEHLVRAYWPRLHPRQALKLVAEHVREPWDRIEDVALEAMATGHVVPGSALPTFQSSKKGK